MKISQPLAISLLLFVGVGGILIILWGIAIKRSPAYQAYSRAGGTAMPLPASPDEMRRSAIAGCFLAVLSIVPFVYFATISMQGWYVDYPLQQRGIVIDAIILKTEHPIREKYYVVYDYSTAAGEQPAGHFQRTEAVGTAIYQQAFDRYYRALKTDTQARIQIRYLPENPAVARISASVWALQPVAQVAWTLGLIAFGMVWGLIPMFMCVWRWLIPHRYGPWAIGSTLIAYAFLNGLVFWLSAR